MFETAHNSNVMCINEQMEKSHENGDLTVKRNTTNTAMKNTASRVPVCIGPAHAWCW